MIDVLKNFLPKAPENSGVYKFLNKDHAVLYIGKAQNIKKRLSDYAAGRLHGQHMILVMQQVEFIDIIVTKSAHDALLLEASLIRQTRPKYNVLLKDDRSMPYVVIFDKHKFPQLMKFWGHPKKEHISFGPFTSGSVAFQTVDLIQRTFLLRSCDNNTFSNRSRPCLLYQIKRCCAPCVGKISEDKYKKLVNQTRNFFKGHSKTLQAALSRKMHNAACEKKFEQAALYRDRIRSLSKILAHQTVYANNFSEADMFGLVHIKGTRHCCIQVFFFRGHCNLGNTAYFPNIHEEMTDQEILQSFISQFYHKQQAPSLILISTAIEKDEKICLQEAFAMKFKKRIVIAHPIYGEKKKLMEHVLLNAMTSIKQKVEKKDAIDATKREMKDFFHLKSIPSRIEVYDNSHIQGTYPVGAMIVEEDGRFQPSLYRRFYIRENRVGNDLAIMHEVFKRRFKETKTKHSLLMYPDLVIVDGGKMQLEVALSVLRERNLSIPIIAIAKGRDRYAGNETFFTELSDLLVLDKHSPLMYYMQRLRDEAHRFAIGTHRSRRLNALTDTRDKNKIAGVGTKRRKMLIAHFGSMRALSYASLDDISSVQGISYTLATHIHHYFHS